MFKKSNTDTQCETPRNEYINERIIYIISNVSCGGSKKYLDDIINNYKENNFIFIKNTEELYSIKFKPYDLLFLQHLLFCDILVKDIITLKNKYYFKIILTIHDFCWFINGNTNISHNKECFYQYSYLYDISINNDIKELINNIDLVIHPSQFTYNNYSKYFSTKNCIVYPHNDISINYNTKRIPHINNTINIAHFQGFTKCKGMDNVLLLKDKYTNYKGFNINIITDLKYDETNWYYVLKNNRIHGLFHLNMYGETYSYALSKSINSGLPILYNNIGAFAERLSDINYHYFKVIDNENEYTNYEKLYNKFEIMLDYIIQYNGKFNVSYDNTNIICNDLYNYLFEYKYQESISSLIHNKIKPFAVYFPQFHIIPENNVNYYNGMTDVVNLVKLNNNLKFKLDTPSLKEYNLNVVTNYNLTDENIINKQIEIAKKYDIYGFAIYYYWFSNNTITHKHTIMENCYDLFFKKTLDFKVFFIWANEDWSNNAAFNTNKHIITNVYDIDNFHKNIDNLMKYFKHENYYKYDNKPVFYIHHPSLIDDYNLTLFEYLINNECISNGFNGIILYVNNMIKTYKSMNNYSFHPNYKSLDKPSNQLDYNKYINEKVDDNSNCIFFDFDNKARLFIPDKLHLSSKFINNNIFNQNKFIEKVLKNYTNNSKNNILLINSWNGWGENMAIEPGNLSNYKYLSLIKMNLLKYLSS